MYLFVILEIVYCTALSSYTGGAPQAAPRAVRAPVANANNPMDQDEHGGEPSPADIQNASMECNNESIGLCGL